MINDIVAAKPSSRRSIDSPSRPTHAACSSDGDPSRDVADLRRDPHGRRDRRQGAHDERLPAQARAEGDEGETDDGEGGEEDDHRNGQRRVGVSVLSLGDQLDVGSNEQRCQRGGFGTRQRNGGVGFVGVR